MNKTVLLATLVAAMSAVGAESNDVTWVEAKDLPIEGRAWSDEARENPFDRLPDSAKGRVPDGVWSRSRNSAGLQLRFRTDSKWIHVQYDVLSKPYDSHNLSTSGKSSIDFYHQLPDGTWEYVRTLAPGQPNKVRWTPGGACLVNLPPHNRPGAFKIGFDAGTTWQPLEPRPADRRKPVVFYGTSIAHGACASRPGMGLVSILGRKIDREVINLGFAGCGTMDVPIVPYLAKIDAACYVIDCVPNMPASYVEERAEPFLRALRKAKPTTPILLCEGACGWLPGEEERLCFWQYRGNRALRALWLRLLKEEPALCKGIRYKTSETGMPKDGEGLADGIHPNDYGMMTCAEAYAKEVELAIRGVPGAVPPPQAGADDTGACAENGHTRIDSTDGVVWTKVTTADVEGLVDASAPREKPFQRFPTSLSNLCSRGVWVLQSDTAGVQARFTTTAKHLWFRWKGGCGGMWHQQRSGVSGLDVYRRAENGQWRYVWTGEPTNRVNVMNTVWLGGEGKVNFSLYSAISELEIGCRAGEEVKILKPRAEKPVVVYGTSITQGCGATRPGMSHVNIMGRLLDRPVVNLGFSGAGKMEPSMVDAVGATDACCYVLDTVWNMGAGGIRANCENFVRALHRKRPGVPIVMCEGCCAFRSPKKRAGKEQDNAAWRKVYDRLKAEDPVEWKSLVYVSDLDYGPDGETSVDTCHANDWGMIKMGRAFAAGVRRALATTRVVQLPPGDVVLTETKVVDAASSGTTFRGAADGSTRLTAGVPVTGWTDRGDGVWGAKLPCGTDGKPIYAESLFVNGRRASRARYPDTGYFRVSAHTQEIVTAELACHRIRPDADAARVLSATPADELASAQLLVHVRWDCMRYPLTAWSDGVLSVETRPTEKYNDWYTNDLYCVENLRSAFDAPGEWFYDAKAGEVLYRPLPGERIREAIVPRDGLETLLAVTDASDVIFENVSFAYGAPVKTKGPTRLSTTQGGIRHADAAVIVDRSTNVVFRNCRFTRLGSYALWFREGCRGGGAYGCEMTDLGGGGVRVGMCHALTEKGMKVRPADCKTDVAYVETAPWMTSHVTVDNCLIAHAGRYHPGGIGVLVTHASDCRVTHNDIFDLYYTGISVGWVWGYSLNPAQRNTIAFNRIRDVGYRELADMGGIYTLGTSFGTCVSNNVISGIHSYSYGGWGIYPDEGSQGIVFENNLVYDTDDASFHQHYGKDNVLRNNIFIDSLAGQIAVTRGEPHRSLTAERNIVLWTKGDAFVRYGGTLKETAKIDWRSNLWWRTDGKDVFNGTPFAAWQKRVRDKGSRFADPLFADWQKRDFTLSPDSPALKLGFRPFDPSLAGRRR